MSKKTILSFFLFILLAFACSSSPPANEISEGEVTRIVEIEVTRLVEVTSASEVAEVLEVTRIVEVTKLVDRPVTVTPTETPVNSPTPSDTPTITPTPSNTPIPTDTPIPTSTPTATPTTPPTATPNLAQTATVEAYGELAAPKSNGFFTVGEEILAGKWRSTGSGGGCYWARLDANQNTIDNHFGFSGGIVNVRPTDFEVEFDDCGTWVYVEGQEKVLQADAAEPKGDGFYTVGVDISPGRWQSTGTGDGCYWARRDGNQNTVDNHFGNAGGTVTINPNDYEVEFNDCGLWEYQN